MMAIVNAWGGQYTSDIKGIMMRPDPAPEKSPDDSAETDREGLLTENPNGFRGEEGVDHVPCRNISCHLLPLQRAGIKDRRRDRSPATSCGCRESARPEPGGRVCPGICSAQRDHGALRARERPDFPGAVRTRPPGSGIRPCAFDIHGIPPVGDAADGNPRVAHGRCVSRDVGVSRQIRVAPVQSTIFLSLALLTPTTVPWHRS